MSEETIKVTTQEEIDKNTLEQIYQNLAELVKKNLGSQNSLLDHIAGRPPGECRAVSE